MIWVETDDGLVHWQSTVLFRKDVDLPVTQ